jgi:murein DD-endopeptidase MepM/ murein hydrolase activator NlpD
MGWPLLLALATLLLSAGTAGCAHKARAALVPQATQQGRFHTVVAGENLFRLSQQYGVPVEAIARENGLDDPMQLTAGRVLFIPGAAPEPRPVAVAQPATAARQDAQPGRAGRLLWPVRGVIYSPFGPRHGEHHDGLDLAAPEGSPIVAAADGTVVYAGEQRGYGRIILVAHAGDLVTVYAHNRDNQVRAGDKVVRGQQLATVGRSGNASGPHLHFEVRAGTKPRDPLAMLRP